MVTEHYVNLGEKVSRLTPDPRSTISEKSRLELVAAAQIHSQEQQKENKYVCLVVYSAVVGPTNTYIGISVNHWELESLGVFSLQFPAEYNQSREQCRSHSGTQ